MTEASQNNKWLAFIKKHKFLILFFILTWKIWMILLLHTIIMPVRCYMWEGKEVEVFLTPEEWRKLSGVNESLKNTEWIDFRRIEGKAEQPLVVMGKQELYKPLMYFNGNEHYLDEVNGKYPGLSIYIHIYPEKILGHDTFILYDKKLEKIIVQYNMIGGYFQNPLSGLPEVVACNKNDIREGSDLIRNYLK